MPPHKTEFVPNWSGMNILGVIDRFSDPSKYSEVMIAVSYVRASGVRKILPFLRRFISVGREVRVVFGDDMNISEKAALQRLFDAGVRLRVYRGPGSSYHPKVWAFLGRNRHTTITTSSNISEGGLTSNVEAGVVLSGKSRVIGSQIQFLQHMWDESNDIDQEYIDSYRDIERTAHVRPRTRPDGSIDLRHAQSRLRRHIDGWMHYIEHPIREGQLQKWRGWYLLPEHGVIDRPKLTELRKVLNAIASSGEYSREGTIDLGVGPDGVRNANYLVRRARITYARQYTAGWIRGIFIRQQKNYLERLGYLEQEPHLTGCYTITDLGMQFAGANSVGRRRGVYTKSLFHITWPWNNIRFFPFLLEVLLELPRRRISYFEFSYVLCHTYHRSELDGVLALISMFKSLSKTRRDALISRYEGRLEDWLSLHFNTAAYGHYRKKIQDLLQDFGYAEGLAYIHDHNRAKRVVEISDSQKVRRLLAEHG